MTKVYNEITVKTTGRNYDFIGTVENNLNKAINICFNDDEIITIAPGDWCGLLATDEDAEQLNKLLNGNFFIEEA